MEEKNLVPVEMNKKDIQNTPPFEFSDELIDEMIKCFREEDGVELTREQANEALGNFAGLYLAYTQNIKL